MREMSRVNNASKSTLKLELGFASLAVVDPGRAVPTLPNV